MSNSHPETLPVSSCAPKLTELDKLTLLNLLVEGKLSRQEIAAQFSLTPQAVDWYAQRHGLSPKRILELNGTRLALDWVDASHVASRRGDHHPAKEALLHAKLIEPLIENKDQLITVNIGIVNSPHKNGVETAITSTPNSEFEEIENEEVLEE